MDTMIQPKITGYRQLSEAEGQLMNRAKALQQQYEQLIAEVRDHIGKQQVTAKATLDIEEQQRLITAEPERWLNMARTDIQVGTMKLVRAVAQPGV